ncbi:hypothetical protein R1flu_007342 [Riccia fluitans]|uniref:Secreted protein n=1 Tax=Riccia fluitans TaxID=41844 RepID=A0ABD1YYT5_9MARC
MSFLSRILPPVLVLFSQPGLCRNLIIESHTSWSPLCNSTVEGRHLRSDDRGTKSGFFHGGLNEELV